MELSSPNPGKRPKSQQPLNIVVSPAGELVALRVLVRQSLEILRSPGTFSDEHKNTLIIRLERALRRPRDNPAPQITDVSCPERNGESHTLLEEHER